jgi:hypothetical protein
VWCAPGEADIISIDFTPGIRRRAPIRPTKLQLVSINRRGDAVEKRAVRPRSVQGIAQ